MSPQPRRSNAAQARRRRPLWWGLTILLILAVATTAVLVLTRGVSWRDRAPITQAVLLEQDLLALVVDTCGAEPEVDLLDEQEEAVQVAVISTRTIGGPGSGDCLDVVEVRLQAPLGDRPLIDVTSGDQITVDPNW
ncbi:hypothetical protein [Xylanimonas ulmi]|uniref:Uncharacterized protein n=1 Tax=Xylanimonas ulmi TaxID=228973 RepID=A0A4Q7M3D2_9MICO|nr:hypothetical protein [Xylanibacterium ulmi]RZS60998.1 hypothetical protein EV386_1279 [Xylanibacterium ulmi]